MTNALQMNVSCGPLPHFPDDDEQVVEHRYKIGQMGFYHPKDALIDARHSPYQIVTRLPPMNDEFQFRSAYEEHERAAREIELRTCKVFAARHKLPSNANNSESCSLA